MATREAFLRQVWDEIINSCMQENWIDNTIRSSEKRPDEPFADLGPVLKRLLAIGASRQDLSLIHRAASYEAVFRILYMLDDPGVDEDNNLMMFEDLLTADPSGRDGRPGSAPLKVQ